MGPRIFDLACRACPSSSVLVVAGCWWYVVTWEKLFGSGTGSGDDQCLGWSDQCLLVQAIEGVVEFAVHAHYLSHCSSHVDFTVFPLLVSVPCV